MRHVLITLSLIVIMCTSGRASDAEELMHQAALQYQVPVRLIKAIAYLESGRKGQIWPWAINFAGQAYYFKDRKSAEAFLCKLIAQGHTNMDVGCMQINLRWHGHKFKNPCDLFSPEIAIPFAASLLKEHAQRTKSWLKAAVLYPSYNHCRQEKYREQLTKVIIHIIHQVPSI